MKLVQFFRKFASDIDEARTIEVKAVYGELETYFKVLVDAEGARKFLGCIKLRVPGKGVLDLWTHEDTTLRGLLRAARKGASDVEKLHEKQKQIDELRGGK